MNGTVIQTGWINFEQSFILKGILERETVLILRIRCYESLDSCEGTCWLKPGLGMYLDEINSFV